MNDKGQRAVFLSKEAVARSQLETAITLWFKDGDLASIHTLAVAANDCWNGLGKKRGIRTKMNETVKGLSREKYDRVTAAENFFKHGHKETSKLLRYQPAHAEVLMFDSSLAALELFGDPSLMMQAFTAHYILSNPVPGFDISKMLPIQLLVLISDVPVNLVPRQEFLRRFLQACRSLGIRGA
jgi:hypothetical protein